jgi:acyl carrier protein
MLERIEKIFRDYRDDLEIEITEQTEFAQMGLDSLDLVELVMNMEEEFEVTIEMSADIKTIGDLMNVIKNAQ